MNKNSPYEPDFSSSTPALLAMPVYLIHGFRWPRSAVRVHIILNNIDDAAAEYIVSPATSAALLDNFHTLYPELMSSLPTLRFIEQYDPDDIVCSSQPFAFVADKVEVCQLSLDIGEVMGQGVAAEGWGALMELRDILAPQEKIGWWIVYNGDEQRPVPVEGQNGGDGEGEVSITQSKTLK